MDTDEKHRARRARAFALLFRRRTFAALSRWLERLGVPRRDRADLVQEALLSAYEAFSAYDPARARPERWLNGITVHVAAHYRARATRRREHLTPAIRESRQDERPLPDEQLERADDRRLMRELLQAVPENLRATIIASELDGLSMATVAEKLGVPLSTAYKWRARGLALLRKLAEEREQAELDRATLDDADPEANDREPW